MSERSDRSPALTISLTAATMIASMTGQIWHSR
jgi:hypothetical protein